MGKKLKTITFILIIIFVMVLLVPTIMTASQTSNTVSKSGGIKTAIVTLIDLNDDGIKTNHYGDGAYFDHDANGFAEKTGWPSSDDGLLILDINKNGIIDNGGEVLGEYMTINGKGASSGVLLLKELDQNRDSRIDKKDPIFHQLRIWQDVDGDGFSSSDELHPLSDFNIKAIVLNCKEMNSVDPQDNTLIRSCIYEKTDGKTGIIGDYMVKRDTAFTIASRWEDVPEDIRSLPDLQGYGNVHDLHQAMTMDKSGKLKQLVRMFIVEERPFTRTAIMEQILSTWAGVDTINPDVRGPYINARRLAILEKFFGDEFWINAKMSRNPHQSAAALLNEAFYGMFEMFYAQLLVQTHLKDLYSDITYSWDDVKSNVKGDMKKAIEKIQKAISDDEDKGKTLLKEFDRSIKGLQAEDRLGYDNLLKAFSRYGNNFSCIGPVKKLTGDNKDNKLYGTPGPDYIDAGDGNDCVTGGLCDDKIYGRNGHDTLYGDKGNDILDGGPGNDYLYGGPGDDIYVFGRGYEKDFIFDRGKNVVHLTKDVKLGDLEFFWRLNKTLNKKDLVVRIKNTRDQLHLREWEKDGVYTVEKFIFDDGTFLTPADVAKIAKDNYHEDFQTTLYTTDPLKIRNYVLSVSLCLLTVALFLKFFRRKNNTK